MSSKCRTIYPDKRFRKAEEEKKERKIMKDVGMKFNITNCTKLSQTCFWGYFDKFKQEIQIEFDTNKTFNINTYFETESDWSLLHFCMFGKKRCQMLMKDKAQNFKHMQIINWLLQNGLNINIQNKWGYTVLYESIMNNPDIQLATYLLNHGADVNMKNIFGSTALLSSVLNGDINIIKLLLKYNGDPRIKHAFYDFTAFDLVKTKPKILIELSKKRVRLERINENKNIFMDNNNDNDENEFKDIINKTVINREDKNKKKYNISNKQCEIDMNNNEEFKMEKSKMKGKTNWEEKYMKKSNKKIKMSDEYENIKDMVKNKCNNDNEYDEKDEEWLEDHCCVCGLSRNEIKKLFQCSRCKSERKYCSVNCQRKDWSTHKKSCKKMY
eukprot:476579_1